MPLYEYQCFVCHKRFEKIQKVNADPIRECPYCSGSVRRLLGVPALQFKGSGWYVTDYGKGRSEASSTAGESNVADSSSSESSSASESTASEAKSSESSSNGEKKTASTNS